MELEATPGLLGWWAQEGTEGEPRHAGAGLAAEPRASPNRRQGMSSLSCWTIACFIWVRNVSAFLYAYGFHVVWKGYFRQPSSGIAQSITFLFVELGPSMSAEHSSL